MCFQNYPAKLHHKLKEVRIKTKLNKKEEGKQGERDSQGDKEQRMES
jgi:hypothetical protein